MDREMLFYIFMLLISVFIACISQVMLKKSSEINYKRTIEEYLNPLVVGSYILLLITTLLSVFAYRKIPLSMGTILETTSYIYITFFGVKIFGEKINSRKLGGLALIITGILLYFL